MKTLIIYISILTIALLTACKKELNQSPTLQNQGTSSQNVIQTDKQQSGYAANELLIKFKKGIIEQIKNKALASITGTIQKRVLTRAMEHAGDNEGFFIVRTPLKVLDAVNKIKALPEIQYAEPNYIYKNTGVPNDPEYVNGDLWGMYGDATNPANPYGSQAGEPWAKGHTGKFTVMVGVIDEGAMYNHPDLEGNIQNPVEFNGVPGVDDDGNGYVDDVYGYDFYFHDNTTYDAPDDDHGTHVSGTIGAKANNGQGVVGVCWNITMITSKFIGPGGTGSLADAVTAIDYITDLKTRDGYNIVATNNSWGGGGYSQLLYDAISRANDQDILFVAAAGNATNNNDVTPTYPASYDLPNIISVAAITSTGALAGFSNYGATTVDLGAPGENIISTLPGSTYGYKSGTSMAAPHVTGAAALYASLHPGATAAHIKAAILKSIIPTPSLQGKTVTGGRLDLSKF